MSPSVLCSFVVSQNVALRILGTMVPTVLAVFAFCCSGPAAIPAVAWPQHRPRRRQRLHQHAPANSDTLAKADALIAGMRRNEVALRQFDRENPPPASRIDDLIRLAARGAATATSVALQTTAAESTTVAPAAFAASTAPRHAQCCKHECAPASCRFRKARLKGTPRACTRRPTCLTPRASPSLALRSADSRTLKGRFRSGLARSRSIGES